MNLKISIIGSTGSIGLSALSIVDKKRKDISLYVLAANKNYNLIKKQILKYKPKYFVITDLIYIKDKKNLKKNTKILNNFDYFIKLKKDKSDVSILAIPGIAGLEPTLSIIKISKKILIANKESIICGWTLIKKSAAKYNTKSFQ